MLPKPDNQNPPAVQPVWMVNETQADAAYEAYAALQRTVQREPHLAENEYFKPLQDTAYARFLGVFKLLPVKESQA